MRILITAGPTREPIDDVRFLSNRSSGRMGMALARAAVEAGHEVTLLLGMGASVEVKGDATRCRVIRFESTADLESLLAEHFRGHDVLIMAAAVADYRPRPTTGKIERSRGEPLDLRLEPTPDLVTAVAAGKRADQRVIAFALEEPDRLEARAAEKLRRKQVDAIVANPLRTMDAGTVEAVLLTADGRRLAPGPLAKDDFARWLVEQIPSL
ncbi:MAG: phosphopantothenoylcysteine decarboxylase [Phycisphaeraceae bacterium]|nr:phosphopantothenoylcysteine decarboxylase [Phycisphaeraceae bacterium]